MLVIYLRYEGNEIYRDKSFPSGKENVTALCEQENRCYLASNTAFARYKRKYVTRDKLDKNLTNSLPNSNPLKITFRMYVSDTHLIKSRLDRT